MAFALYSARERPREQCRRMKTMVLGFMRGRNSLSDRTAGCKSADSRTPIARSWRLHTAESEVIGPGIDLALAARAHDVAGAILLVAEEGTAFVDALFL